MAKYRRMICFIFVFFCGGILHVFLRDVDFTDCFSQLYYGVVVLVWGMLVRRQIIDKRVRNITWGIVGLLELYFLFQIWRYRLTFEHSRLLWYAYYIPMLLIPLLLLFLTLYMNRERGERLHPLAFSVAAPAGVLILLIMTNDFHQLFMRTDTTVDSINGSNMGILVIIYWVYAGLLLLAALGIMFYKCQSISKQKIIQLIIILGILLLAAVSPNQFYPTINGVKLWNTGELYAFASVMLLEASMQVGLIQVNTKYTWIFQETDLPAVIRDINGEIVYLTKGAEAVLQPSLESVIRESDILGGSVTWAIDLSVINSLNRQISSTIEQIEARNHYLTTQNALTEEKAAIDARNRVYDRIAGIAGFQLEKIEELLDDENTDFTERLKKIAVYNVYIKRRSNLELLRESEKEISVSEINTAITESVSYLQLNRINVSFSFRADGVVSVDAAILAYDFYEAVAEQAMNRAQNLSVIVSGKGNELSVRILTDITDCSFMDGWESSELTKLHGNISKEQNDGDSILNLSFERGGVQE